MKTDKNTYKVNFVTPIKPTNTQAHQIHPIQNTETIPPNLNFNGSLQQAAKYYCAEANKLFITNLVLNNQLKSVIEQKNNLAFKIAKLQKQKGQNYQNQQKRKRQRRTANQIQRAFKCPVQQCQKSYGSQGSLSQHLKLKHFEFYQKHMTEGLELNQKQGQHSQNSDEQLKKGAIFL